MILSELSLTLLTLSMSLSLSNLAFNSASTFFDGLPPTAPVIFFNELREASPPPAECVLLCTPRLLCEFLLTCGGVLGFENPFSDLILASYLSDKAGWLFVLLQALIGAVGVVSLLLATPSSPKLALLESERLDRRGDVVQLAAFAESA